MSLARQHPHWTRLSRPGSKLDARWRHASGWVVFHCGHMTAIWPYAAQDPDHPDAVTANGANGGRGWRTLAHAFAAIEGVLEGRLRTYADGPCRHGVRRLIADPADLPAWIRERQHDGRARVRP